MPTAQNDPTLAGTSMGGYFHACGFFRSHDEAYRVLAPFIREGIEAGDKVLHVTDPACHDENVGRLRAEGVDTASAQREGRLSVLTWDQTYFQGGSFSPDAMLAMLERGIHADQEAGFPRTRMVGDMGWALEGGADIAEVMEYEARVNLVLAEHREPAVCMYDVTRIDAGTMLNLLRTHPLVLMGDSLTVNPFYTPPDEFLRRRAIS